MGAESCAEALGAVAARLDDAAKDQLRDASYDVVLHGDGTATVDSDATTGETEVRKDRDRWVITRVNFGS